MNTERLDIIRHRIRERLVACGLTAIEATKRSGLGLSYVNDLLSRPTNPRRDNIVRLAKTLDCNSGWLFGDDLFPPEPNDEPLNEALVLRAAREIEGECRDLSHAVAITRKVMTIARNA